MSPQYITLILKSAGFTTFQINLLTIPAYVLFIVNLMWVTWLSEKLNERFLLGTISQIWVLPLLIALECLPTPRNHWVAWVLAILLFAQPYVHAMLVAITSRNAGTVRTRTVATALWVAPHPFFKSLSIFSTVVFLPPLLARLHYSALCITWAADANARDASRYNMSIQASNIIGANVYRTPDKPYYFTGNKVLIAITVYNIVLWLGSKFFYVNVNRLVPIMNDAYPSTY